MPEWVSSWWSSLSEGNRKTAMFLVVVVILAVLLAGFLGYRFQLLPGVLGQ